MRTLLHRNPIAILAGLFVAILIGLLVLDPIPQDPAYHDLADSRPFFGIRNFMDVASNAGFAVIGLLGLAAILGPSRRALFDNWTDAAPYGVFFFAVALVSAGSGYYHLSPDNDRLFWDRVPIVIAFMALFSAVVADRMNRQFIAIWLLPILVILGTASLLYWDWTEAHGRGDLRFYALVQLYPVVALPVIHWLFPAARYAKGRYLAQMILWYGAAKLFEHFDTEIFALLGGTVSGHSLKHVAAAVATCVVLRMVLASRHSAA